MNRIKKLVWNEGEGRFRAAVRMVLQATLFFIIMKGLGRLIGMPAELSGDTSLPYIFAAAGIRLVRVLASVWLCGRFFDQRPFRDFGLHINRTWWQDFGFGITLGILLITAVFFIELSLGWVTVSKNLFVSKSDQPFLLPFLTYTFLFVCVGFSEELFYRGYQLTNLSEGFNFKFLGPKKSIIIAVFFSSILFGIFHLGSPNSNLVSTINIMVMGILFCVPFVVTGNLAIPIGIHISWNLFQGNVFGFPVSGTTFSLETATFLAIKQGGPNLWTGGIYGPEAGLLNLFVQIAGILLIIIWIRFRRGRLSLHTATAHPPV
jgi:uncharacterized protein